MTNNHNTDIPYRGYRIFAEQGDTLVEVYFDGEFIEAVETIDQAKSDIDAWHSAA